MKYVIVWTGDPSHQYEVAGARSAIGAVRAHEALSGGFFEVQEKCPLGTSKPLEPRLMSAILDRLKRERDAAVWDWCTEQIAVAGMEHELAERRAQLSPLPPTSKDMYGVYRSAMAEGRTQ